MSKWILFLILSLPMIFPDVSMGRVITVCSPNCDYTLIQQVFNSEDLAPGDIIEIQDSRTYNQDITWGANDGGDSNNRVILRAASGQTPTITGPTGIFISGVNYCQVGQNDYGVITIDPNTTSWNDGAITLSNSDYCVVENNTVRDVYDGHGITMMNGADHNIIRNNTVYDIGTAYLSSGSQGEGIAVYGSGRYNIIASNVLYNCAHDSIGILECSGDSCSNNQIINNYLDTGYGNGIGILGARYVLVDGNRIYNHATIQTNLAKSAIQLSASSNCSIRRNIIYNGHHYYVSELYGYHGNYHSDNNYFYNNTIHTWATSSSPAGGGSAFILGGNNPSSTAQGNKFYNNILWDINHTGQDGWYDGSHRIIFFADYEGMAGNNDWGDSLAELNSTGLGGTDIKNNVLRSHGGPGYAYILGYYNSNGSFYNDWSMNEMHTHFPNACSGNIETDPQFSQDPSGNIGQNDTWWHLRSGSACIDAGIEVNDANAAVGGWGQLSFNGIAPDIGASESEEDITPPEPPENLRIESIQ